MNLVPFLLVLAGGLLNAVAHQLLKAGANTVGHFEFTAANAIPVGVKLAMQPPIVGGLACYVVSVVVWVMALSRVEVSIAYPMLSLGYVVNAIAAHYLFGEAVSPMRVAGIFVIILGVIMVARS